MLGAGACSLRTISLKVSDRTPLPGAPVVVSCRVRGADGAPLAGARVVFQWRLPDGRRMMVRTTGARGRVASRLVPAATTAGRRVVVYVRVFYKGKIRSRGVAFVPQ